MDATNPMSSQRNDENRAVTGDVAAEAGGDDPQPERVNEEAFWRDSGDFSNSTVARYDDDDDDDDGCNMPARETTWKGSLGVLFWGNAKTVPNESPARVFQGHHESQSDPNRTGRYTWIGRDGLLLVNPAARWEWDCRTEARRVKEDSRKGRNRDQSESQIW
ncbi:hypothetical protein P175DRAFT_0529182 [Aspergillus ochraceoroseus IBT 24754]|uniref:Uncharacterized protein n=1 Tax=Aspergillus ochraceoroseus IBT 24754 TaxID=1392256 RepID=A0A2T5MAP7_9EURO|nr:uncharacterized protein P175DRAFT_0529182 [Aspergillus ochraceoroseus IBT 24754]PTU25618.1 hypothetical protein P175DRAFT_0529182 [Aspergillus ochraceoroseus IBT 24754]